jgi:hypothetical protein
MKPEVECVVTASFLRSGRVLCNASNFAAAIAGVGVLQSHRAAARGLFAASMACWPIVCYLGVRVAIDASLLRELAGSPVDGGRALDELLRARGLLRTGAERTLADRNRGAFRLWTRLTVAVAIQLALLAAAMVIQAVAA